MKTNIEEAIASAIDRIKSEDFVRAILTGKRRGIEPAFERIDLRPVQIKDQVSLQVISHDGKKDFTENIEFNDHLIREILISGFSNLIIDSESESFNIQITKKEAAIVGSSRTKLERVLDHDRSKERLLAESDSIFQGLGIADNSGRIKPGKRDKYIQINELLKVVDKLIPATQSEINIVDLASGSATLTFAVHHFLSRRGDLGAAGDPHGGDGSIKSDAKVSTVGIERQAELVDKSRALVKKLNVEGIAFEQSEISGADQRNFDLVLALHACDSATDDAIDFVIQAKAAAALIIPCCHQSRPVEAQQAPLGLEFIGRDGILRERFADLITDGLRAERLRAAGYKTEIMEFVGDEHTARNLLIRAVRGKAPSDQLVRN